MEQSDTQTVRTTENRNSHFHTDGKNPPLAQVKISRPVPSPAPPQGKKP
jgi:hypothetical protein